MIVLGEQDERVEKYTSGGIVLRMKGVHRAPPGMSKGVNEPRRILPVFYIRFVLGNQNPRTFLVQLTSIIHPIASLHHDREQTCFIRIRLPE